ncbi:glycosyltransferase [Baekduia soli]|uniref:glycosyltransferase n=1 Tax=Baekduia soli TaxID=496014 RepID=UPI00165265EB|nr:glycosyltransferase [Baekduia soli]
MFSRPAYAWDTIPEARRAVIAPSIDPLSPKNADLDDATVAAILAAAGLADAGAADPPPAFTRADGTPGVVRRRAAVDRARPLGRREPFVLQVSRWDALKDPVGVIEGFAAHVAPACDAHLVYAGPPADGVSDDPEAGAVLEQARACRDRLPTEVRDRVHLAQIPMDDPEENAAVINALQRRAAVVVQKSLAEGFGLTVAEAMWKARPVVASALGGLQDQIEHGRSGLLLDDPRDGAALGAAVLELLGDPARAAAMGRAARERVRHEFLSDRSLVDYLGLLGPLAGAGD